MKKSFEHLNLVEDKKGKTKSFYLKDPYKKVDISVIEFLIDYSKNNNDCDVRVCIHEDENSVHHDMILLQNKSNYYIPHKHKLVGDTFYIIEGELGCFLYSDMGNIIYSCTITNGEMFKTPTNVYHNIMPISSKVIYHEAKSGPFIREHTIIPTWCPALNDSQKSINNYKSYLLAHIYDK